MTRKIDYWEDGRARIAGLITELFSQGITEYAQVLSIALTPAIYILKECGTPFDVQPQLVYFCKELAALRLIKETYDKLTEDESAGLI